MLSEKYLPAASNRHIMEEVQKEGAICWATSWQRPENNKQQNRHLRQPLWWQW